MKHLSLGFVIFGLAALGILIGHGRKTSRVIGTAASGFPPVWDALTLHDARGG